MLPEKFLHYCWRWRRFDMTDLRTTDGQVVEILHPGDYNEHAGPDFFNARIRLDGTLWAGTAELHVRASEWLEHRHQTDAAYDNVVLHVVYEEDQPLKRANGERLPCLELKQRIPARLIDSWWRLEHERHWVPCAAQLGATPPLVWNNWLDRLLVERLEDKTASILAALEETGQHWEEATYRLLARAFGLKVNTAPFEALARSVPMSLVGRHRNHLFQLEALLFGQAGLLQQVFSDEYPSALAKEYRFLQHKYDLNPISGQSWKFLRMRPAGFPTLRIAQFAALLHRSEHLFGQLLEARTEQELWELFAVAPGDYWQTHYQFDKTSAPRPKPPGRDFIDVLLINTVVPLLFAYGKTRHKPELMDRAVHLLEKLPAESNAVVRGWEALGFHARHARETQGQLQLKTHYCDRKRCLECAVGAYILR